MEIKEERYALQNVHDLCSKSFEYNYADSDYSEELKELYRRGFSIRNLKHHLVRPNSTRFCAIKDGIYIGTIDLDYRNGKYKLRRMYTDPDVVGYWPMKKLIEKVQEHLVTNNLATKVSASIAHYRVPYMEHWGFSIVPDPNPNTLEIYTYMEKDFTKE